MVVDIQIPSSRLHRALTLILGLIFIIAGNALSGISNSARAQRVSSSTLSVSQPAKLDALSSDEWEEIDLAVQRALDWLHRQQQRDGSFPTLVQGQPGVTSLCVMAYLANGHVPGEGPYSEALQRSIQFIIAQQKQNGLIALPARNQPFINRNVRGDVGSVVAYNHAISALVLSETYGIQPDMDNQRLAEAIQQALQASLDMQRWPKRANDRGGWRYINTHGEFDSDLSITGWELMFLRSAKNAGFDVPQAPIDAAVAYVRRSFDREYGVFEYEISNRDRRSRGMAGAGILALAHAGFHDSPEAQASGKWLLRHDFSSFNEIVRFSSGNNWKDRYYYGVFNACQGMYQLGGDYWEQFFPSAARALIENQLPDGSWPVDNNSKDGKYGKAYATSLAILALGAPNQLIPIFQR